MFDRRLPQDNFLFSSRDKDAKLKIIDFGMSKWVKRRKYFKSLRGTPYYIGACSPLLCAALRCAALCAGALRLAPCALCFLLAIFSHSSRDKQRSGAKRG